jgi:hypothetical protein
MTASARIPYNPTDPTIGIHIANAIRYTIMAQNEINRAVNVAASVTAFGGTPANIETPALPTLAVPTGQGATLYSALTTLQGNLATAAATTLANLDAGG